MIPPEPELWWWLEPLARGVVSVVIGTGVVQNGLYTTLLALALVELVVRPPETATARLWSDYRDALPKITVLVPAFNEERTVVQSVRSLLSLHYPSHDVIVVNDGSTDRTLAILIEAFGLEPALRPFEPVLGHRPIRALYASARHPNLLVADKLNGGKSDALNAAINLTDAPLLCAVDADTLLEADSLLRAARPFVDEPDRTVVVGGTVRVANGCRVRNGRVTRAALAHRPLVLLQTVEYLRAFTMARLGWSRIGALTIVSGAFGIFSREVVLAVGGYGTWTVGEDLEMVLKIHRLMGERGQPYRVAYVPEPMCWTEVPETLGVLAAQRIRWQRGGLEAFFRHHDMLLGRRHGRVGVLGLGSLLVQDVIAPPVEVIGYLLVPLFWAMGVLDWDYFAAFLALSFGYGTFLSIGALLLEEIELKRWPRIRDLLVLGLAAVVENLGYRQLLNVFRVIGIWRFVRRRPAGWGRMIRRGLQTAS